MKYSESFKQKEIDEKSDKPVRDTIISEDEITNLIILLNTEQDFDKFLEQI